jgi:ABC-type polysaccharide/polyol phosphate transport system ATPase subunit
VAAALAFENVTKRYRGAREYRALRDDLVGAAAGLVGVRRPPRATVTALDGVDLEIAEGQAVGLIGANGAGKTTALKLATRIAYPTSGKVRVRGRVGALIEVGSGMHPELTGRENIRLYGRILGLSGRDIARRFDDIVEFAGIASAIDQPVKQFSSGMQLRLGFAVAAHLEPDVFLVDEAIAVGDAGFQYRCVERMAELVREGRTLVFVSHDMSAIETLCDRAVLLQHGRVAADGPARDVVAGYLEGVHRDQLDANATIGPAGDDAFSIVDVSLHDDEGRTLAEAEVDRPVVLRLHYVAARPVRGPIFSIGLSDGRHGCFALASMLVDGQTPERLEGSGYVDCRFANLPLQPRTYEIWGSVRGEAGFGDIVAWQRLRLFRVAGEVAGAGKSAVTHSIEDAPVRLPYRWSVPNGSEAA